VPPEALGRARLDRINDQLVPVAVAARRYGPGPAGAVDVTATLGSGTVVSGTVLGVHDRSHLVRATYSRLAPKHRLRAWVQLLTLVASGGDQPWHTSTIGRAQGKRPLATVARLRPPPLDDARRWLTELVELREWARREPLPLPVATAFAYARCRHAGDTEALALSSARRAWDDSFEQRDANHVLCWGERAPLDVLLGAPRDHERAWWPDDRTRLGVLSRRVWQPLLDHEETETA
jgi:exodeoxyribonuclease V gamma subunit